MNYTESGVYVIGMTDTGEKITAASGRISTQEGTALEILEKSQDCVKNANLIEKVTASGHTSTVEHTYFNLAFQNVSVVVEQFIIEFRLASFTVKSRRYVNFAHSGFYTPDFGDKELEKSYNALMSELFSFYGELCEQGVAREDARFVLPYCLYSNFYCSVNGRELINMLYSMLWGRGAAFPEIKALGEMLLKQVSEKAPGITAKISERAERLMPDCPDLSFIDEKPQKSKKPVELLGCTEDSARKVAKCALIEYKGYSSKQIDEILNDEKTVEKIINSLFSCRRPRALESVNYTLRFNGVSLSCLTHFARHRIQSIEIPSLIYTDRGSYVVPPVLMDKPQLLHKYKACFEKVKSEYLRLKAMGISEEKLVYYQLSGNTLDIVTTMNARQLLLFMKLRTCNRAQWEIRNFAIEALELLRKAEPRIFNHYGPGCYVSACPEGRLTCGLAAQVKENFSPR